MCKDFMNKKVRIVIRKMRAAVRRLLDAIASIQANVKNSSTYITIEDAIYVLRNRSAVKESYVIQEIGSFRRTSTVAVVLHLFYTDNWGIFFSQRLMMLAKEADFDLYITMPPWNVSFIEEIQRQFPDVNVLVVPNRGRDVLPFIKTALRLVNMGYKKVLKIHSKKSVHRETSSTASAGGGDQWLNGTLDALLPKDPKLIRLLITTLNSPDTGMIGALEYYYPFKMYLRYNRTKIERIIKKTSPMFFEGMIAQKLSQYGYFGGTMFWVDLASISDVLEISKLNFDKEKGQTDRTTAHALERVFCILPQLQHKQLYGVTKGKIVKIKKTTGSFPKWYYGDVSGGKPQISIIVPVYADWWSLSKNIASLKEEVGNSEDISVHYVNDCGPEADLLEKNITIHIAGLTNFYYHRNNQNLGFVKNCNHAVFDIANQADDVLLLNSDTKVTRNFIVEMRKVLYSSSDIGAVTSRSNNATIWSVPMTSRLANHRFLSYVLYRLIKRRIPAMYITPTIHGFCALIRRETINQYGLFDEVYGKGYGEENDFAMRIQENGWKCAVANHSFVFHYESKSFGETVRNEQIEKNEKILLERYPKYRQQVQDYWDKIKEPLK